MLLHVCRQDFVKAVSGFNLKQAFPNMESHPYDWRVDKYEPNRVWFTVRNTATHTGPLTFFGATYKPTGKVENPPNAESLVQACWVCSESIRGQIWICTDLRDQSCCACISLRWHFPSADQRMTHAQVVLGAPECLSYTFNQEGKVTSFTGGYIMDR